MSRAWTCTWAPPDISVSCSRFSWGLVSTSPVLFFGTFLTERLVARFCSYRTCLLIGLPCRSPFCPRDCYLWFDCSSCLLGCWSWRCGVPRTESDSCHSVTIVPRRPKDYCWSWLLSDPRPFSWSFSSAGGSRFRKSSRYGDGVRSWLSSSGRGSWGWALLRADHSELSAWPCCQMFRFVFDQRRVIWWGL